MSDLKIYGGGNQDLTQYHSDNHLPFTNYKGLSFGVLDAPPPTPNEYWSVEWKAGKKLCNPCGPALIIPTTLNPLCVLWGPWTTFKRGSGTVAAPIYLPNGTTPTADFPIGTRPAGCPLGNLFSCFGNNGNVAGNKVTASFNNGASVTLDIVTLPVWQAETDFHELFINQIFLPGNTALDPPIPWDIDSNVALMNTIPPGVIIQIKWTKFTITNFGQLQTPTIVDDILNITPTSPNAFTFDPATVANCYQPGVNTACDCVLENITVQPSACVFPNNSDNTCLLLGYAGFDTAIPSDPDLCNKNSTGVRIYYKDKSIPNDSWHLLPFDALNISGAFSTIESTSPHVAGFYPFHRGAVVKRNNTSALKINKSYDFKFEVWKNVNTVAPSLCSTYTGFSITAPSACKKATGLTIINTITTPVVQVKGEFFIDPTGCDPFSVEVSYRKGLDIQLTTASLVEEIGVVQRYEFTIDNPDLGEDYFVKVVTTCGEELCESTEIPFSIPNPCEAPIVTVVADDYKKTPNKLDVTISNLQPNPTSGGRLLTLKYRFKRNGSWYPAPNPDPVYLVYSSILVSKEQEHITLVFRNPALPCCIDTDVEVIADVTCDGNTYSSDTLATVAIGSPTCLVSDAGVYIKIEAKYGAKVLVSASNGQNLNYPIQVSYTSVGISPVITGTFDIPAGISAFEYINANLKAGVKYTFKYRVICTGDFYSPWVSVAGGYQLLMKNLPCELVTSVEVTLSGGKYNINWPAVPGAKGYDLLVELMPGSPPLSGQNRSPLLGVHLKPTNNYWNNFPFTPGYKYKITIRTKCPSGTSKDDVTNPAVFEDIIAPLSVDCDKALILSSLKSQKHPLSTHSLLNDLVFMQSNEHVNILAVEYQVADFAPLNISEWFSIDESELSFDPYNPFLPLASITIFTATIPANKPAAGGIIVNPGGVTPPVRVVNKGLYVRIKYECDGIIYYTNILKSYFSQSDNGFISVN